MAKNISRHIGNLHVVRRLPSSANGNPRYFVTVDGWLCRTAVDCSLGYKVTNLNGKRVIATIGTHYGVTTLLSASEE